MIGRREFIAGLGGAAVTLPLAACDQQSAQQPAVPVIGYLGVATPDVAREVVAAFRRGLANTGYIEGQNLAVEYRWAEYRLDRMAAFATDLVNRKVAVIIVTALPSAVAAKAATDSIPIVFWISSDPVELGLVASLNRPGGNLTGISSLDVEVAAKRLELLHELVPPAKLIAVLVNPTNRVEAEIETRQLEAAARILGVQLLILNARDSTEFEAAFATLVLERAGGLVISSDPTSFIQADHIVALADRYRSP
jgi:putative ABC transport system substrate-binding protein